jgi:hypothetical protein
VDIHDGHAVARAEDEIGEVLVVGVGLRDPHGVVHLRLEAHAMQGLHRALHVLALEEDVQVLGVAIDARVEVERVGARDHEGNLRVLERAERQEVRAPLDGWALIRLHGRWRLARLARLPGRFLAAALPHSRMVGLLNAHGTLPVSWQVG